MKVLAVDIGGTFIKYAVMTKDMDVLSKGKVPTPQEGRGQLIEAIGRVYDANPDVDGIAISMPGIIDSENGYCVMGGALGYNDGFYLREQLGRRCPVKIHMENDAKCAAMAEAAAGSLRDVEDGFVLIFGTMIGGAFIKGRRLTAYMVNTKRRRRWGLRRLFVKRRKFCTQPATAPAPTL